MIEFLIAIAILAVGCTAGAVLHTVIYLLLSRFIDLLWGKKHD